MHNCVELTEMKTLLEHATRHGHLFLSASARGRGRVQIGMGISIRMITFFIATSVALWHVCTHRRGILSEGILLSCRGDFVQSSSF